MKHYNTPQKTMIDLSLINEGSIDKITQIAKKYFKNKSGATITDHMIYNALRNKPVFHGIQRIKQNKFHELKYYHKPFRKIIGRDMTPQKERNFDYVCYTSPLMCLLKKDYENVHVLHEISYQIGQPFYNANINDEE